MKQDFLFDAPLSENVNEDKDTTLTPLALIKELGEFDFDLCGIASHPTAKTIIARPQDGLSVEWTGRVWLNPPFSNPAPFLKKMADHKNGIALTLNSTDTAWFQDLILAKATGIFLLYGRPKFMRLDGSPVEIMRGIILSAFDEKNAEALTYSNLAGTFIEL